MDEATQTSYVQLKTALIDQLDPAAQENRFRTEFRARRQPHGHGETIAVFGRDIRCLARMAYHSLPLGTRDQLASDQFIDGLANKELRRSVLLSHPKSLDEAIRVAVEFEIASGDTTEPPKQVNSVTGTAKHLPDPVDRLATVLEANTKAMREMLGAIRDLKTPQPSGDGGRGARGKGSIICWNCGLPGHVKAMCRARIDGSSSSTPTPTGAEERVEGGGSDASKEPDCSHNEVNVPPASIKSATVRHVRGKVNGIELGIVIDTGSATTIISQSLLSKLGTPPMSHSQHQVVSATGDPLLVLGTLDVYIEVGTVAVTHPVIVCGNITHECIVGVDFLTLHGFDVKFSTKTLEIMDASAPLLVEDSPAALRRVAICETATVPGEFLFWNHFGLSPWLDVGSGSPRP